MATENGDAYELIHEALNMLKERFNCSVECFRVRILYFSLPKNVLSSMAGQHWEADMAGLMQIAAIDSDDEWLDLMLEHYADHRETQAQEALRRREMTFDLTSLSSVQ